MAKGKVQTNKKAIYSEVPKVDLAPFWNETLQIPSFNWIEFMKPYTWNSKTFNRKQNTYNIQHANIQAIPQRGKLLINRAPTKRKQLAIVNYS